MFPRGMDVTRPYYDPGPQSFTLNGQKGVSPVIKNAPNFPWDDKITDQGIPYTSGHYWSEADIYLYTKQYSIFMQPKVNKDIQGLYLKFLKQGMLDLRKDAMSWKYPAFVEGSGGKSIPLTIPHPSYIPSGSDWPFYEGTVPLDSLTFSAVLNDRTGNIEGMPDLIYIPAATWRDFEMNLGTQVGQNINSTTNNSKDPFQPLRKPGDLSNYLDNPNATANKNANFDENQMVDWDTKIDLTNFGISKESCEIVGLGAIPVMWYCNKNDSWKYLAYYAAISPLSAFAVTKLFHEKIDYSLKEWNSTVNQADEQTNDYAQYGTEIVANLNYVITTLENISMLGT